METSKTSCSWYQKSRFRTRSTRFRTASTTQRYQSQSDRGWWTRTKRKSGPFKIKRSLKSTTSSRAALIKSKHRNKPARLGTTPTTHSTTWSKIWKGVIGRKWKLEKLSKGLNSWGQPWLLYLRTIQRGLHSTSSRSPAASKRVSRGCLSTQQPSTTARASERT